MMQTPKDIPQLPTHRKASPPEMFGRVIGLIIAAAFVATLLVLLYAYGAWLIRTFVR